MKVVFDENVFEEIDHFHPNFDESVPNPQNIRKARRGAAPGPSSMTYEHLFTLLESEDNLSLFSQIAGILARGDICPNALEVIRKGRMSALRKIMDVCEG